MAQLERYIDFICDLLVLDDINIIIKDKDLYTLNKQPLNVNERKQLNKHLSDNIKGRAFTIDTDYYLYINLDKHTNNDEYLTASHELRHLYQLKIVNNNDTELENKEIIKIWEDNIKNYKNASNDNYGYQSIEQDANAFTSFIIKKIFNRDIYIKDKDSNFNKWYQKIENDFSDDEIKECLELSDFQSPLNRQFLN